jgi:hypothetical protein
LPKGSSGSKHLLVPNADTLFRKTLPLADKIAGKLQSMKTATTQQLSQQWTQILRWLASDEEVLVTQDERIIARILPSTLSSTLQFRAKRHLLG